MAPTEALVQLAHEDARSLYMSLLDDPALSPLAWEGLAALRPDADNRRHASCATHRRGPPLPWRVHSSRQTQTRRSLRCGCIQARARCSKRLRALLIAPRPRAAHTRRRAHACRGRCTSLGCIVRIAQSRGARGLRSADDERRPCRSRRARLHRMRTLCWPRRTARSAPHLQRSSKEHTR